MEICNICCSDFSRLSDKEIDALNRLDQTKYGYYLEPKGLNRLDFPCYYLTDIIPSTFLCRNFCMDIESAYIAAQLSNAERFVILDDPKLMEILKIKKFEFLKEFMRKEIILTTNSDIFNMTKELLNNEAIDVNTAIKL